MTVTFPTNPLTGVNVTIPPLTDTSPFPAMVSDDFVQDGRISTGSIPHNFTVVGSIVAPFAAVSFVVTFTVCAASPTFDDVSATATGGAAHWMTISPLPPFAAASDDAYPLPPAPIPVTYCVPVTPGTGVRESSPPSADVVIDARSPSTKPDPPPPPPFAAPLPCPPPPPK